MIGRTLIVLLCLVLLILGMLLESKVKKNRYIDVTNEVQVYKVDRLTITSEYQKSVPYYYGDPMPMFTGFYHWTYPVLTGMYIEPWAYTGILEKFSIGPNNSNNWICNNISCNNKISNIITITWISH